MPKDRFGNERDWAIGELADGTIDSMPLSEWPKRAAEIAHYEAVWDQVLKILNGEGDDQPTELDLDALTIDELNEIIAGLSEDDCDVGQMAEGPTARSTFFQRQHSNKGR
jgi:hypothetical protein